jgi:c-di-GMP-binding flagellar brake protein YcgR
MGLEEKRRYKRVRVSIPVEIFDILNNKYILGRIIDISAGGVAVVTNEKLEVHTPISLNFELVGMKYEKIPADVVREIEKEDKYYLGIAFFNMSIEKQEELDRVVRRIHSAFERGFVKKRL